MKKLYSTVFASVLALCATAQLSVIESVEYDAINQRFLVSNNSEVAIVNGNGTYIGAMSGNAAASYGMEVMNGKLFAITNNTVKAFELTTGLQQMSLSITGSQFLNGMASNGSDKLWVSDFGGKKIYEVNVSDILNPTYTTVATFTSAEPSPNGLLYEAESNRLLFVTWGSAAKIKSIDLATGTITQLFSGSNGNMDGIDRDAYGHYYVSSWSPSARITQYNSDFSTAQTITVSNLLQPADIAYATEIDTLIIPSTGNTRVYFVGFNPAGVSESESDAFSLKVYPTPAEDVMHVGFELSKGGVVMVEAIDVQGRSSAALFNEALSNGKHQLILDVRGLTAGAYTLRVLTPDGMRTSLFVKQ